MLHTQRQLEFTRFAAPREDRSALVVPPLEEVGALVAENFRGRETADYDLQGRSLQETARQARRELLAAARRWTAAYRDLPPHGADPAGLVFLAGHQPELFHPGVWFKNFALGHLAQRHGATAVNLVIDSDTAKEDSLRVPGGSAADPRLEAVPFDRPGPRIPHEERSILDRRLLGEFGRRAAERIAPLVRDPLVRRFWPMVLDRAQQTDRLGYCLAQARHQLEGQWGLQTLEIPQGWVCECAPFRWFVVHLLAQLPRFHEVYNQAVQEYRRVHRIRNAAHPVPDLATDGPWIEAPFWIWTAEDPQRRRLLARSQGRGIVVSDGGRLEIELPLTADSDAARAVEQLADWSRRGVKIRSRALTTTLWARLALGDLFLHGIGGAKYDQVTDLLIERFFGLKPPGIMVLSATLHLPVARPANRPHDAGAIRRELRELTFHPEKHLRRSDDSGNGTAELAALLAAKDHWIRARQTVANGHARWSEFRRINAALQPWVADRRQHLLQLQEETTRAVRRERVLGWREYGFCLYPEENLRGFLDALLPKSV